MNASVSMLLERKGSAVHTLVPSASVAEAVQLMNRSKISSILIVEQGRLAGIFTERDVLRRVVGENLDPKTTPLSTVMSAGVRTITPATSIEEALGIFTTRGCRHLPVLDGARLTGLISVGDISRWLAEVNQAEAEHLKNYINGGLHS
jgi:CBS domain-containing protein